MQRFLGVRTDDEVGSDVLAFLVSLANATGIDLAANFERKMRKNEVKYPVEAVLGRYKKPEDK